MTKKYDMNSIYNHPVLTAQHHAQRTQIRQFAETQIKPEASELDRKATLSKTLIKKMGDFGLFGMTIPAAYGGSNMGFISYIITKVIDIKAIIRTSQAGRNLKLFPVFSHGSLNGLSL